MSFFAQSPRFMDTTVVGNLAVHTSRSLSSGRDVGPGSYSTEKHKSIEKKVSPKRVSVEFYNRPRTAGTPRSARKTNGGGAGGVSVSFTAAPSPGSFGTSERSSPLERNFIKGGIFFNGPKHEERYTVGPGSYQDAHYKGSPSVVASEMLHRSFNTKIKQARGSTFPSSPRTPRSYATSSPATPRSARSEGVGATASSFYGNIRRNSKSGPSSAGPKTNLFSSPHVSRPHENDFITQQTKLNRGKSLKAGSKSQQ
ncbi:hypothetical protein TrST_g6080 [Triparma strigata]|uniref:Uncharacterized protein n=1 Tax=Triparma strigata TaxID=1606541 RepID=A0A9W7BSY1_9STRA|nr:hypothetical protein TrST_g6080 [Triparma strigata]